MTAKNWLKLVKKSRSASDRSFLVLLESAIDY